jgi:hypothetical protein
MRCTEERKTFEERVTVRRLLDSLRVAFLERDVYMHPHPSGASSAPCSSQGVVALHEQSGSRCGRGRVRGMRRRLVRRAPKRRVPPRLEH